MVAGWSQWSKGMQIDLLLDRADRAINLCAFKFYEHPIALTAAQVARLEERRRDFIALTGTRSVVYNTLVSPYGIVASTNAGGVVAQRLELGVFFD